MTSTPEKKLALIEHLRELRVCLIRSLIALVCGTLASLYFSKEIFRVLQEPLLRVMSPGSGFIATSPLEGFMTYLKVSLLAGIFLSSPFVIHQIWRFVAPALYKKEKRVTLLFVVLSTLFFAGGALFGYFVIFPAGFRFFVTALEGTEIRFLPQMRDYLAFISKMLLTFGLVFEMPLVLVLLERIGLVSLAALRRGRRYVIVLMFLAAGILTPGPDVISQLLLALPLLLLYEVSILVIRILQRQNPKEE